MAKLTRDDVLKLAGLSRLHLTEKEIDKYEKDVKFVFPEIYKKYLLHMNGTDKPTININAYDGTPPKYSIGYYSYPRDIDSIKSRIDWIFDSFSINEQKVTQKKIPHILPLVEHRFLVIDQSLSNPVLSMYGDDVILYAESLDKFLFFDIFENNERQPNLSSDIKVKFWLEQK